ncbi:MAG: monovalent cation:proton antiporter-2 (CPA2) family protein [Sphingomonas sp.]
MLGVALVFVTLFRRLGLGATLGYIVAGALIGPSVLGYFREPEAVQRVSEIGISLLLFIVGLELQPSRLWRLRRDIFGLGLAQVVLCGAVLSLMLYFTLHLSLKVSIAIGLPLALSSTAQVLPMLRSENELNTPQGERTFSILLFQDLAVIPLITIIAAMAPAPDPSAPTGWKLALFTLVAVVGLVAVGRLVLNPLFRLIGRFGERELFIVAGLFTVIGAAAVMRQFGLSTALGALVAGVVLAESPYRHEIESDVEPFRSILLGLFFLSVGMLLDLHLVAARPMLVLGIAVSLILTKTVLIAGLCRIFGNNWPRSVRLGLLLSQAGEYGFVLFGQSTAARLVSPEAASLFSAVVTLSMVATPFLMRLTDWLEMREERGGEGFDGPELSPETSAIVVGYGRFGQTVAQMLQAKRIGVTIIDKKPSQIELSQEFGTKVYYGDGLRIDLLRTAGAETAKIIAFCNDNEGGELSQDAVAAVLEAFPQASIMVRVFDRRHMLELDGLDIAFATRELFESAVGMGKAALTASGIDSGEAERVEREYRLRDCQRLERQSRTGDVRAGWETAFAADRPLAEEEPNPAVVQGAGGGD